MPRDPRCCKPDRQWTLPRRLRVPDIIALLRPHSKLAFLSACQTAKGDEDLSDEAIHIAAGMLFVDQRQACARGGKGHVRAIVSKVVPHRIIGRLHTRCTLLSDGNVPFEDRLPFIHAGL